MDTMSFESLRQRLPIPEIREVLGNESDFYGISDFIAREIGLPFTPRCRAVWGHGWPYFPIPFVESYVWSCGRDGWQVLTLREEQAAFLREQNVSAVAVGAPILYVKRRLLPVEKIPRSLLVMPTHSLDHTRHAPDEIVYLDAIAPYLDRFDLVVACVHPSCQRKNLWLENLECRGIPWVLGVEAGDRRGLERMSRLFSSVTHMTTNGLGSHLPYAAYHGCSTSIFGPMPEFEVSALADEPFYKKNPHILEFNAGLVADGYLEKTFAAFFRPPDCNADDRDWAAEQLGERHMKSPAEIGRLLGWRVATDDPTLPFASWAATLGWTSPDPEVSRLREKVEKLTAQRETQRATIEKLKEEKRRFREQRDALQKSIQQLRTPKDPPTWRQRLGQIFRRL